MQEKIVSQTPAVNTAVPEARVERIAYRPKGRLHPEQWLAKVGDSYTAVTPASAKLVIDMGRASGSKRYGLLRRSATDGGRKWWIWEFGPNEFASHLAQVVQ